MHLQEMTSSSIGVLTTLVHHTARSREDSAVCIHSFMQGAACEGAYLQRREVQPLLLAAAE